MNTKDVQRRPGLRKEDEFDRLLAKAAQSGLLDLDRSEYRTETLPASWRTHLMEAALQGQKARTERLKAVSETMTFGEYLAALRRHASVSVEELAAEAHLDPTVIVGLENAEINAWNYSVNAVLRLLDALRGSPRDAIDRINRSPIKIDRTTVERVGPLVARSEAMRPQDRREVTRKAQLRIAEVLEQRKKDEFLKELTERT